MSLNDIELKKPLVSMLYGNYLIDCHSGESKAQEVKPMGGIMILCNISKAEKEADLELLTGIMKACRIESASYQLMELDPQSLSACTDQDPKKLPRGILCFGETGELATAGFEEEHYIISQWNGIPILAIPSLPRIAADKKIKLAAWESLKKFFAV